MRLKARPDLHHAPLPNGVFVSAGTGEFALSGWAGFADLMSRCLPLLNRGADEDELVAAIGTDKARGAVRSLLSQLDAHGMVLHLDTMTSAEPDGPERERHAELLAYLECQSDDPYAAFEEIRSARVLLVGPEEAIEVASRALQELGVDGTQEQDPSSTHNAAIVAMRREQVEQLPPRTTRFVPVVVGASSVVVGPLVQDLGDLTTWRTLVERALDQVTDPVEEGPATAVAVSLAVHLLLQHLAAVAGPSAYIVSGEDFDVRPVDLAPAASTARAHVFLPGEDLPSVEAAADWLTRLTDPWVGLATGDREDDLSQMPVALRRLKLRDQGLVLAAAYDQEQAAASAALAVVRHHARGAAGLTSRRWLLDGALRLLVARAVDERVVEVIEPQTQRLLASLDRRVGAAALSVSTVPGLSWRVARCALPDGRATTAWGATDDDAVRAAATRALAAVQVPADAAALLGTVGTDALVDTGQDAVGRLAQEVQDWAAARDLVLVGSPAADDPILGPGPVHAGMVRWQQHRPSPASVADQLETLRSTVAVQLAADVQVMHGWDPDALTRAMTRAQDTGRALVTVTVTPASVVVGPLWTPDATTGCAGCAELRQRTVLDHVLVGDLGSRAGSAADPPPTLVGLASRLLTWSGRGLDAGELVAVSDDGISRHRIARHPSCTWCGPGISEEPAVLDLHDALLDEHDPTRVAVGTPLLQSAGLDAATDARYGPVRAIMRESNVPFAMSMAVVAGAPVKGHGRALTFAQTRSVAVLEAYERLAGFPHEAPIRHDVAFSEISKVAVDPRRLGRYTAEQLQHPTCKVRPFQDDEPMDWAWGVDLADGRPRLVPAEVGFYQYDHRFKRDQRASQRAQSRERRRYFMESSSGCALGSSVAEAALHALFEVAERDAFQLAWHRGTPLPEVPAEELRDPVIHELLDLMRSHGFEVHFLVSTSDIELPVIWVLAISRDGTFPASFSSAGSGADPLSAARAGLREVAQLATMPLDWTHQDVLPMLEDPWLVRELEHHVQLHSAPEMLPRAQAVLGGPLVTLAEAFPGWPDALRPSTGGILGTLRLMQDRFAKAGLDEIVLVDQSTREHRDLGIHVVKAVVPGTIPMVFGRAHQRVVGIPRLDAALAGRRPTSDAPYDPHPFP